MATNVIMPVLGVSQDSGKIIHWHKREGDAVQKGEPLLEVETDKAVVDIEAPASGVVGKILAEEGQEVPVTQVITVILAAGEKDSAPVTPIAAGEPGLIKPETKNVPSPAPFASETKTPGGRAQAVAYPASPLAVSIAAENNVDLSQVKPKGSRIEKADVLNYIESQKSAAETSVNNGRQLASPKARRLAIEREVDLKNLKGSGPDGAVLAVDVSNWQSKEPIALIMQQIKQVDLIMQPTKPVDLIMQPTKPVAINTTTPAETGEAQTISTVWRIMAEHTTQSWQTAPHIFLMREVNAGRLISWRERLLKRETEKITYSDLLVKIVSYALRRNPGINASWNAGTLLRLPHVNVGLAVTQDGGLVVPVIHDADTLTVSQIAQARAGLVEKARAGKLRPADISGGTFTISNLGMYGVDAFTAIINAPQAAILAVGRISDRVVALKGVPVVQPVMILSLSCDHRVVDGARGAQFLEMVADLIEEPAGLVE